ncbi:S-adenosyl-L-methionine-dependent methyltransferase [Aureobasidium subglaciale]|nr:S-adenosyl-L-methionine-dependent methyltransferase [Aureobasidium subglaciale]
MDHRHHELTAANRDTWDSKAKDYDAKPWQKKIASQVAEALTSHADWLGADWASAENRECRLLDYACGTGSVTRALSNHITHATGLDISPAMLEQYTTLLSSSHPSLQISTAVADFCSCFPDHALSDPESNNFNIAGVALGFHHFSSPATCLSNLYFHLSPSGVLFVIDWLPNHVKPSEHMGSAHLHPESVQEEETEEWKKMKRTIKTNGFEEKDMRKLFEGAGFEDFGFVVLEEKFVLEMNGKKVEKTGFIAKGRKV